LRRILAEMLLFAATTD